MPLRVRLVDLLGKEEVVDCDELAFLSPPGGTPQPTPRNGLLLLNPSAYRLVQFLATTPPADTGSGRQKG